MAIEFARLRYVKRSDGGNACRSAAYNARADVKCDRTGERFYFAHREPPLHHDVLLPEGAAGKFRDVAFPGVTLFLVAGELEPASSWWMLDIAKRGTPSDTIETYGKGMELWLGALHLNGIRWHDATTRIAQAFVDALVRRGNAENTVILRVAAVIEAG